MSKQLNVNLAFTADTSQAQQSINALKTSLQSIVGMQASPGAQISADMKIAVDSAKELQVQLTNAFNVKTGNLDLNALNTSLSKSGQSLATLTTNLLKAGQTGQQAFMNIQRVVANSSVAINQANGVLARFATTLANTARWQLSSSLLHGFIGSISSAFGYAEDLNESLNKIRIVTGYSSDKMAEFAKKANDAAKALSTTTVAYSDAALIFFQQGLKDEEVEKRANITTKLANVTGESVAEVSNQLTAVWNNFAKGSENLEYYVDVITALGAATASSSKEITTGLEKFAAVAETVGLSYEYATAALATVTATTRQSAEVVGTAFKTLFARIQDLELGKTLDDGTTLGSYSEALAKVGVDIKDANGNLKDMNDILDEMGAKWQQLDKDQQVALAKSVAGIRQYTQLIALMDNWSFMEKNVGVAESSMGTLQKQADTYAESWGAAKKEVKAALEELWGELIPTDFLVDMTKSFAKVLEGVTALTRGFGGLEGILLLISTIVLHKFQPAVAAGINGAVAGVQNLGLKFKAIGGYVSEAASIVKSSFSEGNLGNGAKGLVSSFANVSTNIAAMNGNIKTFNSHVNAIRGNMSGAASQVEYFDQNLSKGASEALKIQQATLKQAAAQTTVNSGFAHYLDNMSQVYNIQGLIEKYSKNIAAAEKAKLSASQEQIIAATEKKLLAQQELDIIKKQRELLVTTPSNDLFSNPMYVDMAGDEGMPNGWSALDTDITADSSLGVQTEKWTGILNTITGLNIELDTYNNKLMLSATSSEGISNASAASADIYGRILDYNAQIAAVMDDQSMDVDQRKAKIIEITDEMRTQGLLTDDMAAEYKNAAKSITQQSTSTIRMSQTMTKTAGEAKTYAQTLGNGKTHLKAIEESANKQYAAQLKVNQASLQHNQALSNTISLLQNIIGKTASVGGVMSGMFSGLSTIAMGYNSISNAIDTLNDKSADFGQKFVSIAMAGTMGFQGLMTVVRGVGTAISAYQAAQSGLIGVNKLLTASTDRQALAQAMVNATTKDGVKLSADKQVAAVKAVLMSKLKISSDTAEGFAQEFVNKQKEKDITLSAQETVTNIGLAASEYAVLWPLLLIIAALAVVGGLIWFFCTRTNQTTSALEKAQEALEAEREELEALNKNLEEAKTNLEDVKKLLDDYANSENAFENLVVGSEAWNEQLLKHNELINEILKKYPELAQYLTWEGGVATLPDWVQDYMYGTATVKNIQAMLAAAHGQEEFNAAQLQVDILKTRENRTQLFNDYYNKHGGIGQEWNSIYNDDQGLYTISRTINGKDYSYQSMSSSGGFADSDGSANSLLFNSSAAGIAMMAFREIAEKGMELTQENFTDIALARFKAYGEQSGKSYEDWAESVTNDSTSADDVTTAAINLFGDYYSEYLDNWEGFAAQYNDYYYEELRLRQQQLAATQALYMSTASALLSAQRGFSQLTEIERQAATVLVAEQLQNSTTLDSNADQGTKAAYIQKIASGLAGYELSGTVTNMGADNSNLDGVLMNTAAGRYLIDNYLKEHYGKEYNSSNLTYSKGDDDKDPGDYYDLKVGDETKRISADAILKEAQAELDYNNILNSLDATFEMLQKNATLAAGLAGNYLGLTGSQASSIGLSAEGGVSDTSKFTSHIQTTLGEKYTNEELGINEDGSGFGIKFDESTKSFVAAVDEGTELTEAQKNYLTEANTMLQNAQKYNASAAEAYQNRIDEQNAQAIIATSAEKYELNAEAVKVYADTIRSANKENKISAETAAKVAVANARYTKGIKALSSALEKNEKGLQDWADGGEATYETAEQINEVMTALTDVLGMEVSADFIKQNYEDIKKLTAGGQEAEEALNRLELAASKDFILNLNIEDDYKTQFEEMLNYLNSSETDITIGASMDISKYTDGLEYLLNTGAMTRDQVEQMFAGIEWAPEIKEERHRATEPSTSITRISTMESDSMPGDGDWADAESTWQKVETYPEIVTYSVGKEATFTANHSGSNVRAGAGGGSGGGGGGSQKKDKSKEKERYHDIKTSLDKLSKSYDAVSEARERAFGADKLSLLEQEQQVLEDQLNTQRQYIAEIEDYYNKDRSALETYGAEFAEDGTLLNYDALMDEYVEKVNTGKIDEEAYTAFKDALSQYEETWKLWLEESLNTKDMENKLYDFQLEKIKIKLELDLSLVEDQLEWLEYQLENIEDAAYDAAEAFALLSQKATEIQNKTNTTQSALAEFLTQRGITDINDESQWENAKLTEAEIEWLREQKTELLNTNKELRELKQEAIDQAISAYDEWNAKIDENIDKFDHYSSIVESFKNIIDIVGKDTFGIADEALSALTQVEVDNATNKLAAAKEKLDASKQAEAEILSKMVGLDKDSEEYKILEETLKHIQEQTQEAEEEMMSNWEDALQSAADAFEQAVERSISTFEKAMAGTYGSLDELQKAFEQSNEVSERYVEDYKKIYELSKLNRDVMKSIDETDNVKAKQALRDLQKEINNLQNSNTKMSQYELDHARKKYELRLAEIALEEAQNAKSQVRMRRDSEGNYSYVFTADQDALDEAQQNYEDKLYEMQELNSQYIKEMQNNILQSEIELTNALRELDRTKFASDAEYYAKVNELTNYYMGQRNYALEELNKGLENNQSLVSDDWATYSAMTGYKMSADEDYINYFNETTYAQLAGYETIEEAQNRFLESSTMMVTDLNTAFAQWQTNLDQIMSAAGSSVATFGDQMDATIYGDEENDGIIDASNMAKASVKSLAEQMLETFSDKTLSSLSDFAKNYQAKIRPVIETNEALVNTLNEFIARQAAMNTRASVYTGVTVPNTTTVTKGAKDDDTGGGEDLCPTCKKPLSECKGHGSAQLTEIQMIQQGLGVPLSGQWDAATREMAKMVFGTDSLAEILMQLDSIKALQNAKVPEQEVKKYGGTGGAGGGRPTTVAYKYDTGGYTGDWGSSEGRMAMLHQKELVLNADDTENMLATIELVRNIARVIDLNAGVQSLGLGYLSASNGMDNSQVIEQQVTIHAEFPEAQDRNEIKEAFSMLINEASQFANRKNL